MKISACALIAFAACASASVAGAQTRAIAAAGFSGVRVGYLSPSRAFNDSVEGKAAMARLTALAQERQKPLDEKGRAIQTERAALVQLTGGALSQKEAELQRRSTELERAFQDLQRELSEQERDAHAVFIDHLRPAIADIVKERGLQVVFNDDKGNFALADSTWDLTAELVRRLDHPATAAPSAAPAPPAQQ